MQLTEPFDVLVVNAAQVAPAEVPKRSSLPSRLPSDWSTGSPATAGTVTVRRRPRGRVGIWYVCSACAGQGRVGLQRVAVTAQTIVATDRTSITPKITAACRKLLSIRPNMTRAANGNRMMLRHSRKLVQALGFSNGWRVGAEEAAAVGAQLLDGDDGRHRSAGDRLQPWLSLVVVPIAPGSTVATSALPSKRHRHARRDQQHAHDEGQRQEHIDDPAPQIDVEVAHVRGRRAGRG